jgi:hypothetical protein
MLPLYSKSIGKAQFTVVYRGYELDVARALSGWRVGVHPKQPICQSLVAAKYTPMTKTKQSLKPRVE